MAKTKKTKGKKKKGKKGSRSQKTFPPGTYKAGHSPAQIAIRKLMKKHKGDKGAWKTEWRKIKHNYPRVAK